MPQRDKKRNVKAVLRYCGISWVSSHNFYDTCALQALRLESLLGTLWLANAPRFLQARYDRYDSDKIVLIHRLVCV